MEMDTDLATHELLTDDAIIREVKDVAEVEEEEEEEAPDAFAPAPSPAPTPTVNSGTLLSIILQVVTTWWRWLILKHLYRMLQV